MTGNIPYISREQTEKLLNCFAEAIQQPKSNPLLFNVWGIGGVGKTRLLDRLQEVHSGISFARVYFGSTTDIATPLKLMANLYRQLPAIDEWGEEFERFTELYQKYEQTLEKLKQADKKESEAQTKERKDAIKKLVGGSAKTLTQVTPLKNIPGAEDKIGLIAEGGVDLVDWLQKQRVTRRDKELQALMLKPIPKLTEAFVRGLIAKSQIQPVVLLLDTYEKTNSKIDNWLWQYLIANSKLKSHAVRVVVAGRKNLLKQESWRKLQQDFSSVYSLEIERFTPEQTQNYLAEIGINNNEAEAIYQVTKGLPYYLDWIRKQKLAGKELDFSQGNQEIVNLLLQGLNKEQKKVIQLAACCRWFGKSLIKHLVTSQELDFTNTVDTELNCFEWLERLDFVEYANYTHRLDDVARDVFRLSLWQEDRGEQFRQVNDLLAIYYEDNAIAEVPPDRSPRQMYENQEWKDCTAESLYHALFARQQDCETKFLSHLFSACYLQETEVVTNPFDDITAEVNIEDTVLLSSAVKKFLQNIKPIFDVNCLAFELFVNSFKLFVKSNRKDRFQTAIEYCFDNIDSLEGLAKFAGLLFKAKYCPLAQKLRCLQLAKSQAEKIVINSDPKFSSGLFIRDLGNALNNLGRYSEAIASFDRALEIQPDLKEAWYNRGLALGNLGRYDEAIAAYDQAIEIKPDKDEAWYGRGLALANLGRLEDAIAAYDRALEIKPDDDEAWNNRGNALNNLGRYDEALAAYDRALEIKPDNDDAWNNRGVALGNLGRYEEEIAAYDKAIEIKPDNDQAWNNRGVALGNLGRYEEEIASYDKAIEIKPDKDAAWYNRGIALANLGRYDEAIASYDRAIEIKPDKDEAWYIRGVALANLGRYEDAISSWDKTLEIKPDLDEAWYIRGLSLAVLGRYDEAIASYDRALEIKPDYDEAWNNRGVALGNLGRYEEAIASYDRALEIKPDKDEAWYNRGVSLSNLGRHEEEIAAYDRALEIKPDKDEAWYNRGVALANLGRYSEAIAAYDKAIEIKPDKDEAWYNRACCFALQNQIQPALEDLAKAISLDKEYQEMAKTDSDFDNIRYDARFQALISTNSPDSYSSLE